MPQWFLKRLIPYCYFLLVAILLCLSSSLEPIAKTTAIGEEQQTQQMSAELITETIIDNLMGKCYMWRGNDGIRTFGTSIAATTTNDFYFVGYIDKDLFFSTDFLLGKINSTGAIAWITVFHYEMRTITVDLAIDEKNQLLFLVGESANQSSGNSDIFLSCYNYTARESLWNKTIGSETFSEYGKKLAFYEGKLFVTGLKTQTYNDFSNPIVLFYCLNSSTGATLWQQEFHSTFSNANPLVLIHPPTEKLFLSFNNYTLDDSQKVSTLTIFQLSPNGRVIWKIEHQTDDKTTLKDMTINSENEQLYLVGDCKEKKGESNLRDAKIFAVNFSGEILQELIWGAPEVDEKVFSISSIIKQEFYVLGKTTPVEPAFKGPFLAYFNSSLKPQWFRNTSGFYSADLYDIIYTSQEQIITIGSFAFQFDLLIRRLFLTYSLDNDRDSLSNFFEEEIGTDPNKIDTDHDGYSDLEEYFASTDPLDPRSTPPRRNALKRLGVAIAILLIISFFMANIFLFIRQISNKKEKKHR